MFQKFNFDTEWAVTLISKITNDEDIPIEGQTIVKQVFSETVPFCITLFDTSSFIYAQFLFAKLHSFWPFKLMLRSTSLA